MYNKDFNVVELFSGPGGLGLGFHMQGFRTLIAYEYEDDCINTYSSNFPDTKVIKQDLTKLNEEDIKCLKQIVLDKTGREDVDIVMGGPSCRSFSSANPKKTIGDSRDFLYRALIRVASELNAKYFIMENVADINNKAIHGHHDKKIFHCILEDLLAAGFKYINCDLLNAANYGTPQTRERLIILATRDKTLPLTFPKPMMFKNKEPKWVTVEAAFQDLPDVSAPKDTINGKHQYLVKKENRVYLCDKYGDLPKNDFTKYSRGDFDSYGYVKRNTDEYVSDKLHNFILPDHTHRIIERYNHLKVDESQGLLKDRLLVEMDADELKALTDRGVIPKGTFRQKNRRVPLSKPSRTVTSHAREELVHPIYNRNLTARETARLQGFPDKYIFRGINQKPYKGTGEDVGGGRDFYQQIGDAVPPLLATAIAWEIKKNLVDREMDIICSDERESLIRYILNNHLTVHEIIRNRVSQSSSCTIRDALTGTVVFNLD